MEKVVSIKLKVGGAEDSAQKIQSVEQRTQDLTKALKALGYSGIKEAFGAGQDQLVNKLASSLGLVVTEANKAKTALQAALNPKLGTFSAGSDAGLPAPLKAFLAPQKQLRQAMAELRPNLNALEREFEKALKGSQWNFGHTGSGPQSFGSDGGLLARIIPNSAFKQAEKDLKSNLGHLEKQLEKELKGLKWAIPEGTKPSFLQSMAGAFGSGSIGKIARGVGLSGDAATNLSGIFGTLGALRIAFWELKPIINAVKFGFEQMIKAFSAGENLFIKASQLGRTTGAEFSARFAGNAIGLSSEESDRLALQSAQGKGGGGGHLGRFDAITKLLSPSLAKPFEDAYLFSQKLGAEWQKISGELFTSKKMLDRVTAQWDLFWAEIAAKIGPSVRYLFQTIADLPWAELGKVVGDLMLPFRVFIDQMTDLYNIIGKLGILKPQPGSGLWILSKLNDLYNNTKEKPYEQTNLRLPGGIALPQLGQWEKLGLTFGAGGNNDAAQQTAVNTKKSADMLSLIAGFFSQGGGGSYASANSP